MIHYSPPFFHTTRPCVQMPGISSIVSPPPFPSMNNSPILFLFIKTYSSYNYGFLIEVHFLSQDLSDSILFRSGVHVHYEQGHSIVAGTRFKIIALLPNFVLQPLKHRVVFYHNPHVSSRHSSDIRHGHTNFFCVGIRLFNNSAYVLPSALIVVLPLFVFYSPLSFFLSLSLRTKSSHCFHKIRTHTTS